MSVLSERKEAPLALFETHKSGNRDVSVKRLIVWLGQKRPHWTLIAYPLSDFSFP